MKETCSFDAAPLPTTDFLISLGEYSLIGILQCAAASIAAPRA